MAKNIAKEAGSGSDHATKHHNVKARAEAFKESMERMYRLDQDIAAILTESVKPLRDDKAEIKSTLREDYNVTATAFNARYHAYKFERKAKEAGDDASLDMLRELFEASPVGGQVNFMDALDKDAAATH
jgi:hypothetical protein